MCPPERMRDIRHKWRKSAAIFIFGEAEKVDLLDLLLQCPSSHAFSTGRRSISLFNGSEIDLHSYQSTVSSHSQPKGEMLITQPVNELNGFLRNSLVFTSQKPCCGFKCVYS